MSIFHEHLEASVQASGANANRQIMQLEVKLGESRQLHQTPKPERCLLDFHKVKVQAVWIDGSETNPSSKHWLDVSNTKLTQEPSPLWHR